jgi:hypothetical protein
MGNLQRALPILDYDHLRPPLEALHRFIQIVGKMKLATVPPRNHWWHVALRLTSRGLATGPMPIGRDDFPDTYELEFDLLNHRLKGFDSWGHSFIFSIKDMSVADFYRHLASELERSGIRIPIHAIPYKLRPPIPFDQDDHHVYRGWEHVTNYFDALRFADHQLKLFASSYLGKESPSHFFWHSLDLSMTRYSGKRVEVAPGREESAVLHEALTHEFISFGFWPGDERSHEPTFYAHPWPAPQGITGARLSPERAHWYEGPEGAFALLKYADVRESRNPGRLLQQFFQSAYEAGASYGGWNTEELDAEDVGLNNAEHLSHQYGPLS